MINFYKVSNNLLALKRAVVFHVGNFSYLWFILKCSETTTFLLIRIRFFSVIIEIKPTLSF